MPSGYEFVRNGIETLSQVSGVQGEDALVGIGPKHSPRDPLLAKLPDSLFHVFIKLPPTFSPQTPPVRDSLQGEWNYILNDHGETTTYLNLSCPDPALMPTFHSLVGEMIDRMAQSGNEALPEFFSVLDSWRNTLKQAKKEINQRSLTGMFGELETLVRVSKIRPSDALRIWRGTAGHYHDFAAINALEIKTYRSHNSPVVSISGIHQLDPPHRGHLHLRALHIEDDEGGQSLRDLYEELIRQGLNAIELQSRLDQLLTDEEASHRRFRIVSERIFRVDEKFPGIRASQLDETSLVGVSNVSYQLHLDTCPNQLDPALLDTVILNL